MSQANETNREVTGLVEAAEKVGTVVNLISEIAEQTNLLALNATIEAARAGDAGKGFAVVANEVKSLASQTAKATGQISGQIDAIQSATTKSAAAIEEIARTIQEMSQIASNVAAAVEEQNAATGEISRSVQEAASGTQDVSRNISGVGDAAGATGDTAGHVLTSARGLSVESDRLRGAVEDFLRRVRAA